MSNQTIKAICTESRYQGQFRPTFRHGPTSTAVVGAVYANLADGGRPREIPL